jgi:pyruvate/2-oxoacid:ferredoxin oxidoreductase alpha subunit
VFEECRYAFIETFGRDPRGSIQTFFTNDAESVVVASGTIATTAREVVRRRRENGEKVGLIKIKMFRPWPEAAIRDACRTANRIAVLDRNYAAGMGGIFWQELRATLQNQSDGRLIQGYLAGVCGGDVTPEMIDEVISDLEGRSESGKPVWMGMTEGKGAA